MKYIKTVKRSAILFIFITFISGCATIGPDFEVPETKLAENWTANNSNQIKTATRDYRDWWRVFNDATLDTLIEAAYEDNLTLLAAGLRVLQARAELGVAVGNLYPQEQNVQAGAGYNSLSEGSVDSAAADLNYWNFNSSFNSTWEIDFWGKFRRGIEAADAELLSTIANYDDVLVSLIAEVANTYLIIRTFEERIQLAEHNIETQQKSFDIAKYRFESGITTELDVQQAKTLLLNTQATVPQLKIGLRQAQHALSILLNRSPGELREELKGSGGIPVAPLEVVIDMPAELLRRRPDVRRAELDAATQSALIGVAKADLYPSFTLFGSLGLSASGATRTTKSGKDGVGELFNGSSLTFLGGTGVRWNVLNFGRIKNSVRAQDARFQQSIADYQDTVLRAAAEVENSIVGFVQFQEAEQLLHDSYKAANRSVEIATIQYRDGAVNYQRVLDSNNSLLIQQDIWTQTRSNISRNLIAIFKAMGGGWEMREGKPFVQHEIREQMQQRTNWGKLIEPEAIDVSFQQEEKLRQPDW